MNLYIGRATAGNVPGHPESGPTITQQNQTHETRRESKKQHIKTDKNITKQRDLFYGFRRDSKLGKLLGMFLSNTQQALTRNSATHRQHLSLFEENLSLLPYPTRKNIGNEMLYSLYERNKRDENKLPSDLHVC